MDPQNDQLWLILKYSFLVKETRLKRGVGGTNR